jgi:hypothetical protein
MNESSTQWTVTAFLFSGRRNPQWKLTPEEAKEWMNKWRHAPLSPKEVKRPSVLGYTGCSLQYNEHSYWMIFDSCVSFYDQGLVISKEDTQRGMEKLLFRGAPDEIKKLLEEPGMP